MTSIFLVGGDRNSFLTKHIVEKYEKFGHRDCGEEIFWDFPRICWEITGRFHGDFRECPGEFPKISKLKDYA